MKELISVVIPVFNTCEYLEICINSVLQQTYMNLEIILVDDGSDDGSDQLCKAFGDKDHRIKVIYQSHLGVVAARKRGVKEASGEFILFVDSDDYIESNMIEEMERVARENRAEIITSGYTKEYAKADRVSGEVRYDEFPEGMYTGQKLQGIYQKIIFYDNYSQHGILPGLWCKLFRKKLIENNMQRIPETITNSEDACLVYMCCMDAAGIFVLHKAFYHYYMRENSCIHTANKQCFAVLDACYQCLYQKVIEMGKFQNEMLKQLENFVAREAVYCLKNRFGFSNDGVLPLYIADLKGWDANTKIVLYGAGRVGSSFYKQITALGQAEIVLWVDRDERIVEANDLVNPIEMILETEYDYILLGLKDEKLSIGISESLKKMGVIQEKIVWKKPTFILDVFH